MKYILTFIFLAGCGLINEKAVEDFIEGEAKVVETVVEDVMGPSSPTEALKFPVRKF